MIEAFDTVFTYPCDSLFFDKGSGVITAFTVGNEPLRVRIVRPPAWRTTDRRPAMILFFGGAWRYRCVPQLRWFWEFFSNQGFVVIIADYRLGTPVEKKAIPDGRAIVRWVRLRADSLGVHPDKIIAMGSSSGGHLAAATACITDFEHAGQDLSVSGKPDCVVSCWPVLDLTLAFSEATSVQPRLVSPSHKLSDTMVPTLVMTGQNDPFLSGVESFMRNAKKYRFDSELKIFPDAGHDFGLRAEGLTDQPTAGEDSTKAWTMAFLEKQGFQPITMQIDVPDTCRNPSEAKPLTHSKQRAKKPGK